MKIFILTFCISFSLSKISLLEESSKKRLNPEV